MVIHTSPANDILETEIDPLFAHEMRIDMDDPSPPRPVVVLPPDGILRAVTELGSSFTRGHK